MLEIKLKKGDVILVEGKSLIAKTIGLFTHSKITHAACATGLEDEIIESDIGGVQRNRLNNKYTDYNYHIYRYNGSFKQAKEAADFMISKEGLGYDYCGLFGIGAYLLHIKKYNTWDNKNRYWCSELVADGYINAGVILPVKKMTPLVSPADFLKFNNFTKIYEYKGSKK